MNDVEFIRLYNTCNTVKSELQRHSIDLHEEYGIKMVWTISSKFPFIVKRRQFNDYYFKEVEQSIQLLENAVKGIKL